ncbi:MAG: hypothetical protein ACI86X_001006 [Moritella sp.]|jgi:uncharacterized protein YecT (DUF1311 family)
MYKIFLLSILALFSLSCRADVAGAGKRELRSLESFQSVADFEAYNTQLKQSCLSNAGNSTHTDCCFNESEIWNRELTIYYKKLRALLSEKEKSSLQTAQQAWKKYRDAVTEFNSQVLANKYADKVGSMYSAMRSGEACEAMAPIIKDRTLFLKTWYEKIKLAV